MTETLTVAVIGAGRMGSTHARVVHEHPRARLALVVDPDEAVGRRVAEPFDATWAPSIEDALEGDVVEAFVVAVPDRLHVDLTVALLEAGRQGIHDIDLVQWVAGHRITQVCATTTTKLLPTLGVALAFELHGRIQGALADQFDHFVGVATARDEPAIATADAVATVVVLDAIAASLERPGWQTVAPV